MVLSTNVLFGVQSVKLKEDGLTGMYYDYAMAAPLMADIGNKEKLDMLILGMGSGTYATQCERYFGNVSVEGVEIDDKITMLARKYFDLPKDVEVTTYDGRAYLNAIDKKYDVIMVDAYQDITIPFQMSSVEFFTLVKEHLAEDGVMVVNMNMRGRSDNEKPDINDYLADTISSVFENVRVAEVDYSTNTELFASDNPKMMERMEANIELLGDAELKGCMRRANAALREYEAGNHIMTDDKAPVELLGMQVIDDIIRDEVSYYKKIYEEQGIKGIIDSL